jgi:hypothetical protein
MQKALGAGREGSCGISGQCKLFLQGIPDGYCSYAQVCLPAITTGSEEVQLAAVVHNNLKAS